MVKLQILLLLLLNVLRALDAAAVLYSSNPDEHWKNFKETFKKLYKFEEEMLKRKNFEANWKKINEHNLRFEQGMHSFEMGFNEYSDLAIDDFVRFMYGLIVGETSAPIPFVVPADAQVNDSVDYRKFGVVTPVRNQLTCGSCYAISATGALEGQNALRYGKLVPLSAQNIIDCSTLQGNEGCAGGFMDYAFQYVMLNEGLDDEVSYPYKNKVGICRYKEKHSAIRCAGYSDIIPRDEATLKIAVGLVGPISVGINANHDSFQLYKSGIYNEPNCSSNNLNHAVLVVGYGSENGEDYWIIKNSWGTSWGENGYMRMSRNKNNQCGIASLASFPVI